MKTIERQRWIPYPADQVYLALTDPNTIEKVVKRIESLEILERDQETGTILVTIDLPGGRSIETEGKVDGIPGVELTFTTEAPFPMVIKWRMEPDQPSKEEPIGTQVTYNIALDLSPIVAFVPDVVLRGYLSSELESDLERLESVMRHRLTPVD